MPPPKLALFLALAVALLCAIAAEPLTPDGLLSSLDKRDRVMLTTADGETREITVEEMDRLAKQQHTKAMQIQREKTADVNVNANSKARVKSTGGGNDRDAFDFDEGGYEGEEGERLEVEMKEDEENAPTHHTESLEEIRKKNPSFATNIELSRRAFQEIQRHGYARGYEFSGFSEKDVPPAARDAKKPTKPMKSDSEGSEGKNSKKIKREDYKVTLVLRAKRHPTDRAARTGTSAQKREQEPLTVSYEVQVFLDAQDQFSVVTAWELDGDDKHGTRLSIQPSAALLKKQQQAKVAAKKTPLSFFVDVDVATGILAGGVALILAGIVVLYTSQKPGPAVRRNSADNWELATDSKKNK